MRTHSAQSENSETRSERFMKILVSSSDTCKVLMQSCVFPGEPASFRRFRPQPNALKSSLMPVINRRDDAMRVGGLTKDLGLRVCGCPCRFMVDRDLERNAPR